MARNVSAQERISSAFVDLLLKQPFIGLVGLRFPIVRNDDLPTMYVDGRVIGYNEQFVMSLNLEELKAVVAHEVLHLAFLHLYRRGARNQVVWNYATDLAVNWILKEQGFKLPDDALFSEEFENMPAEKIYDILIQRLPKMRVRSQGLGSFAPESSQGLRNGEGGDGQSSQGQHNGGGNGQTNDRDLEEEIVRDLVRHGASGTKPMGSHDLWGKNMTPEEKENAQRNLENILRDVMLIANQRQPGSIPGSIERLVKELLEPKIHWTKYVKRFLTPREEDMCFTSPSIYYSYRGDISPDLEEVPLPGEAKSGEKLEGVVFVLDTSGSISPREATQFVSEMQGLMRQFPETQAWYMSCDVECTDPVDLQTVDGSHIDIRSIRLKGGGGTSFKPPFEYFERPENRRKYDVKLLVYFTDAYGDFPDKKPPFPTIFCVTTDAIAKVPKWATAIRL